MLCDICHEQEGVIFYTLVINNQKSKLLLCESCAAKKGLINPLNSFELKDLIPLISHPPEVEKLKCPRCGLSYKEFMGVAKFGCPDCYKAFEKEVMPLLRRIHGSTEHIGKSAVIKCEKDEKEIKTFNLKKRLREAVEGESYEEAARIRDELKKIGDEI